MRRLAALAAKRRKGSSGKARDRRIDLRIISRVADARRARRGRPRRTFTCVSRPSVRRASDAALDGAGTPCTLTAKMRRSLSAWSSPSSKAPSTAASMTCSVSIAALRSQTSSLPSNPNNCSKRVRRAEPPESGEDRFAHAVLGFAGELGRQDLDRARVGGEAMGGLAPRRRGAGREGVARILRGSRRNRIVVRRTRAMVTSGHPADELGRNGAGGEGERGAATADEFARHAEHDGARFRFGDGAAAAARSSDIAAAPSSPMPVNSTATSASGAARRARQRTRRSTLGAKRSVGSLGTELTTSRPRRRSITTSASPGRYRRDRGTAAPEGSLPDGEGTERSRRWAKAPVKEPGMCWGDHHRPGQVRRQFGQDVFQVRGPRWTRRSECIPPAVATGPCGAAAMSRLARPAHAVEQAPSAPRLRAGGDADLFHHLGTDGGNVERDVAAGFST